MLRGLDGSSNSAAERGAYDALASGTRLWGAKRDTGMFALGDFFLADFILASSTRGQTREGI